MGIRLKSIARMTRQMATYQDSFVDTRKALASLANGTSDSRLAASLRRVVERVKEGDDLFQAFSAEGGLYPPIFVRMTKIGEESGSLANIYTQLADFFDQQVAMRRRFALKLIYPCFMVAALVLVHSLLTAVLTTLLGSGSGDWAAMERLFLATLAKDLLIIIAIIVTILLARAVLVGRTLTDVFVLFVPPLRGPMRKLILSRFSLSMYLMTGSAIPLPEALRESGKATNNAYVEHLMDKAALQIEDGNPLTPTLEETGLFPPDFIDIVYVAEESGSISESLKRVSVHYAEDADIAMTRLVNALAWGIYMTVAAVMVFYIIKLFAGYVSGISGAMGNY